MDPFVAAVLKLASKRLAAWWLEKRPLSKESRLARKQKRALNKTLKKEGLSRKERKMKLLELLVQMSAAKRTSTKSGAAGLVLPPLVAAVGLLPFYDDFANFIREACAQPDPTDFIVAGGAAWLVTWVSMFVSARLSKTPTNPGKL